MAQCSMTASECSKNWPEGTVSANITMNPYLLALAEEQSFKRGMKLWEFINASLWESLGKPDHDTLMEFAATMDITDEDPKWKKRLKITARHEVEMAAARRELAARKAGPDSAAPSDGDGGQ